MYFFFNRELQEAFGGLFPKDDPKNTRFAINFFTSIGLGGLTYVFLIFKNIIIIIIIIIIDCYYYFYYYYLLLLFTIS
jgi:hypothetical protein